MSANKLSEEEIIMFLNSMFTINISREQLLNPNKDTVIAIYSRFLGEFGVENVTQPDIIATTGMNNIEIFESKIILWNIYKSTANIVAAAGLVDMSFADIIVPKRMRTIRIISALCLLSVKLTNIENKWNQFERKCVDLPQRRQIIEQRIRELKTNIEEKSMYLSNNENKSNAIIQELETLAQNLEKKREMADKLGEDSRTLKSQILTKREKTSEVDVDISKIKEELQSLEQKIVKSPDRMLSEIKMNEKELEDKRNEKKKIEKQHLESTRLWTQSKQTSKSLKQLLDDLNKAFDDTEKIRTQCELLNESEINVNNKDKILEEFEVKLRAHEKSVNTLRKKLANDEKQFHKQIETMKQINNGIKNDLENKLKNKCDEEKACIEERMRLEKKLEDMKGEQQVFKQMSEQYLKQHSIRVQNISSQFKNRMLEYENIRKNN